jgi:hypothetical protein
MIIDPEGESIGHVRSRIECLFSVTLLSGNPDERPIYPSTIPPEEFLAVVKSFFEFGTAGARTAGLGSVPRKTWTWKETHAAGPGRSFWTGWSACSQ